MKGGKVNREWHLAHRMPANATRSERIAWHAEHASACACRPVPSSILDEVKALERKRAKRAN